MVPPPVPGRVAVERVRRVAGAVRLRKGHIERDCWSMASMVKIELNQNNVCMFGCGKEREMRRRPDNFSGEKTDSADDKLGVLIG